jgi:hypothetical protein
MRTQASIRWSTWGSTQHGHGSRSTFVEKIPQGFVVQEGKLYPVYEDEVPEDDSLLSLIRSVEEGIENVRTHGVQGFGETWHNREMFEINFRSLPEKGEKGVFRMVKSFWASEGWKEHQYD